MAEKIKILMVDDHPIILEGYKKVLLENRSGTFDLEIETANSCDEANEKIENSIKGKSYNIAFLDIGLPPSGNGEFLSGEDLGRKMKKVSPQTKLIVLTMFNENVRLLSILKSLDPEAFMIKSDVTPVEFLQAFDKVLEGRKYSSHTVDDLMRKQITNDFGLDKTDREILLHLSQGVMSKQIPELLPISLAKIEKRKKRMREVFGIEDIRDLTLINRARELGFL